MAASFDSGAQHPSIGALILAGGGGERLGGVLKANVRTGGVRLIDRVIGALGQFGGPLLVAHGRHDPALFGLPPAAIPLPDPDGPIRGPLAGLIAAAGWCAAAEHPPSRLLSIAVDTPFFPTDFAMRAATLLGPQIDAIIAAYGGQDYPTNALWRVSALAPLMDEGSAEGLAAGGLKAFIRTLRTGALDWAQIGDVDPFANVNTPADLAALDLRARR